MNARTRNRAPLAAALVLAVAATLSYGITSCYTQGEAAAQPALAEPFEPAAPAAPAATAPDPTPEAAMAAAVETATGVPGPEPTAAPLATPTVQEQLAKALEALAKYKAAEDGAGKRVAIMAIIAAFSNLLIMLLKLAPAIGVDEKRWRIPLVAAGLALVVGFTSHMAAGSSIVDSMLYGAGPLIGAFLHQLWSQVKNRPPAPGAARA